MLTFEQISWGLLAIAALMVSVLLLMLFMQKEIAADLTAGGLKP